MSADRCSTVCDLFALPHQHCTSCHDDHDSYDMAMMVIIADDYREIEVCCDVGRVLKEKGITHAQVFAKLDAHEKKL